MTTAKPTAPSAIPSVPTPVPSRDDRANFRTRMDTHLAAMPGVVTGENAALAYTNQAVEYVGEQADAAEASATTATAAAAAALSSAGVVRWVTGTNYAAPSGTVEGVSVVSTVDNRTYRDTVGGVSSTDPATDVAAGGTRWILIDVPSAEAVGMPTTMPTLVLNPVASGFADPRVKCTRAGDTAMRINEAGWWETVPANVLRLHHDPVTRQCVGYLIEAIPNTQTLLHSDQPEVVNWAKTGLASITTAAGIAPTGLNTARKVPEDTGTSQHILTRVGCLPYSTQSVINFIIKPAGRSAFALAAVLESGVAQGKIFDGAAGTVAGNYTNAPDDAGITVGRDGYVHIWIAVTNGAAGAGNSANLLMMQSTGGSTSYTGDGTSGFLFWSAWVNPGNKPMSPVISGASAAVRAADLVSVVAPNLSAITADNFTVAVEYSMAAPQGSQAVWALSDNSTNDYCGVLNNNDGSLAAFVKRSGVNEAGVGPAAVASAGQVVKVTSSYALNSVRVSRSGAAVLTDTSVTLPTGLTALCLGARYTSGTSPVHQMLLRQFRLWPSQLPDQQHINTSRV